LRRIGGWWRSQFYTEVAHLMGESSNFLFETLAGWNAILQDCELADFSPSP
jgi:hypothetical protein